MSVTWSDTEKGYFLNGTAKRNLHLYFSTGVVAFAIDNSQIVAESMQISESICDDRQLDFGLCTAREFKVRITNTVSYITSGIRLYPSIQLIDPSDSTNILAEKRIGAYIVKSAVLTDDRAFIDITAYDALSTIIITNYADWHNGLTFPMTLQAYFESFLSEVGLTLSDATDTLPCASAAVTQSFTAENYTGYDILYAILRPNGAFGYIDDDGTFRVKVLAASDISAPSYEFDESDYKMGSFVYSDYSTVEISGIQSKETETDIGVTVGDTDGSVIVIEDDPLLYGKTQDELTTILTYTLNSVDGYTYTPASVTTPWMPWIKLGEAVQVSYGDTDVVFPMLYRNISGIVSTMQTFGANGTNEPLVDDLNTASREIRQLQSRQHNFVNNLDELYSEIVTIQGYEVGAVNLIDTQHILDSMGNELADVDAMTVDGSFTYECDDPAASNGFCVTSYEETEVDTAYIVRFFIKLSDGGPITSMRILSDYVSSDVETSVSVGGTVLGAFDEVLSVDISDSDYHEVILRYTSASSISYTSGDFPSGIVVMFNTDTHVAYTVDIKYIKWEVGNMNPTSWSPAQDDENSYRSEQDLALANLITENRTSIQQTDSKITSSVSTLTTAIDGKTDATEVATMIEQNNTSIDFKFTGVYDTIKDNKTATDEEFKTWNSYIRFVDGNIILGKEGNQITCKIENDILGFYSGDTQVAYLSNNKLYVTDGEFLNSLKVGYLQIFPRSDKSLDITYNVD